MYSSMENEIIDNFHDVPFNPTNIASRFLCSLGFTKFEIWFMGKFGRLSLISKIRMKFMVKKLEKRMKKFYEDIISIMNEENAYE